MNEADRKLLTKKMGECWHEGYSHSMFNPFTGNQTFYCDKCKKPISDNRTFITPDDFFAAWEWAKEQEWWIDFIRTKTLIDPKQITEEDEMCKRVGLNDLINPIRFPELVVQFGKEVLGWT